MLDKHTFLFKYKYFYFIVIIPFLTIEIVLIYNKYEQMFEKRL